MPSWLIMPSSGLEKTGGGPIAGYPRRIVQLSRRVESLVAGDPLSQPVGVLMRPIDVIEPDDSLRLAADMLRESPDSLIPVVGGSHLTGVVSERSLARCLADGAQPDEPASLAMIDSKTVLHPAATGAEALRLFAQTSGDPILVLDDELRVLGILAPSDLYPKPSSRVRPTTIGGMATPFGVYLTTGYARSGPGDYALVLTGALLFTLATGAMFAAEYLVGWMHVGPSIYEASISALSIALFLVAMRSMPLAGIHAAEHKVVHAIERGEELTPAIVRRMPRVHPRCGTNVAVGVSLFIGLGNAAFLPYRELQLLLALLVTAALWRPLGGLVQLLVTTRPPSEKHIRLGIRSGEELLDKCARAGIGRPPIWRRLLYSGLPHVIAGSLAAYFCLSFILGLFGIHDAV